MEESEKYAKIHVCIDDDVRNIALQNITFVENLCIKVCRQLGIGPVARHLFALRNHTTKTWINSNSLLSEVGPDYVYDLRLRFKVPHLKRLMKTDMKAYDYYFHQARCDVLNNKIPDISYEKWKNQLLGLGVADMYRVMLEKGVDRDIVESDYKKYISKEVLKNHPFFIKKPIHNSLGRIKKIANHDAWYVKGEYLKQLDEMAPNYLSEEYKALADEGGSVRPVFIHVCPFHETQPGVRICYDGKKEWQHLCTIDDLCYVSARNDGTVEISRKNGIPSYFKFNSIPLMFSLVSVLDGYYRLMAKWTFNLCKDVATPSLQRLYSLKCHGPVGGEFSYCKLEEKRANQAGCYIFRESESKYEVFFLDVCTKNSSKPRTLKIVKKGDSQFLLCEEEKVFPSMAQLVANYRDEDGSIYLQECIPPSEYDKTQLLLCQLENNAVEDIEAGTALASLLTATPQCIDVSKLQVYKNQKIDGKSGFSEVYRSVWLIRKGKKVESAMKILKQECRDEKLKEFLTLAGRWAFLQSTAVVKLYGMTLSSPHAMVMEYLSLGPLDQYLRKNRATIKVIDLVEAATYLAAALWHLEEHGIVHGNIRCRKVLVSAHDEHSFAVRLADPGLHVYTDYDTHWISPECHLTTEFARSSPACDVWGLATTLWELFSFGDAPPEVPSVAALRKYYHAGRKLPMPAGCPVEIYRLLVECWDLDAHRRKKPQAVMRDINQVWYQVFNSRRSHSYAKAFSVADSNASLFSAGTDDTYVDYARSELGSLCPAEPPVGQLLPSLSAGSSLEGAWVLNSGACHDSYNFDDGMSPDISDLLSHFHFSVDSSGDSVNDMQGIFELDGDAHVVLQGRIGQGFYGEVYRGTLEQDKDTEPQLVAVKKLKTNAIGTSLQDFEREISIMKTLKHPNIVEIKGVIQDPEVSLVMEFVPHGSLQNYLKIHREALDATHLLKFALDVAQGMEYLGRKSIVHRDLAARNILVASERHVKISDFGLAQVMGQNDYYIIKTNRELPIKWYAPESLRDGRFSARSDVWSYGVTLYEMFSLGAEPCLGDCGEEQRELLAALESGKRLPCPPECPQEVYVQLMSPCWRADTHARPAFTELCAVIDSLSL